MQYTPGKQLGRFSPLLQQGLFSSHFRGIFFFSSINLSPFPWASTGPAMHSGAARPPPKLGQMAETTMGSPFPWPPSPGGFCTFNLSLLNAGLQLGWGHACSAQPRWDSRSRRIRAGHMLFFPAAARAGGRHLIFIRGEIRSP